MTDETPKPGTPEYDAFMANKYRRQFEREPGLRGDGKKEDSYDHILNDDGSVRISIRRDSTIGPPNQPEYYSAEMADPQQVAALEREVEKIRRELEEVAGYDHKGEPVPRFTGEQRRGREIRLEHLERVELPVTRELQARAAAWRAANVPSTLQTLLNEKERKDRLADRAQEIADEREAQKLADRVEAQRRNRG